MNAAKDLMAMANGMPFEPPGAYWSLIDGGIDLRRTSYDLEAAAAQVRRTAFPDAEPFASIYMLNPPDMLQMFTQFGLDAMKAAGHGA